MAEIASLIVTFLPLILLLWIANLADARYAAGVPHQGPARLAYGLLAAIYLLLFVAGLLLQLGSQIVAAWDFLPAGRNPLLQGVSPDLLQRYRAALPLIGMGLWGAAAGGMILLLRPVRNLIGQVLPLDPDRTVHGVALALTMLIVVNMVLVLAIGLDTVADLLLAEAAEEGDLAIPPVALLNLWVQQLAFVFWAAVGVGWLTRRSLGRTLTRLGIVVPGGREAILGVGVGIGLVFLVGFLSGIASLVGIGRNEAVESLSQVLLGPLLTSLPGILTIGLAAALGEETLFRGALQPRFGLLLTTLLFAITHNNYGISFSTLIVFVVGLILGLLRRHFNTTTSMIAHATYNTTLGLLGLLALRLAGQVGA